MSRRTFSPNSPTTLLGKRRDSKVFTPHWSFFDDEFENIMSKVTATEAPDTAWKQGLLCGKGNQNGDDAIELIQGDVVFKFSE
ncbi:developmentally-regulated protein [Acrasis kona]|uniref:Developmentally-regulated protein n=1 Tax=Acrasis kona TaxID=1008807 RepID=A0AAW2Z9S4_9EUKA